MDEIKEAEVTVTELTELIKNTIKCSIPKKLCIIGEISNFKMSGNNLFFTLKDDESMISAIVWNYKNKNYNLENGKMVKVYGGLTIYGKSGSYNLNCYKVEQLGIGNLYNEYIKLKNFYEENGYFDSKFKKSLPININKIAILTAIDGAALQDFIYVLKKNGYLGELYVKNSVVQGKDCPISIANNLAQIESMNINMDVIIIARGGGSFEDLFGFSDQQVIEAIHNTKTCTISAIGHEIDFMLSDFVADIRAPTPSIAGEIVCQNNKMYNMDNLNILIKKIENMINGSILVLENEISNLHHLIVNEFDFFSKLDNRCELIKLEIESKINKKIAMLENSIYEINTLINKEDNPLSIMSKGYCLVTSIDGQKITNLDDFLFQMGKKKKLKLQFINSVVTFDVRSIKIDEQH
jgi:exodeoxyribonuclease VII large subunit